MADTWDVIQSPRARFEEYVEIVTTTPTSDETFNQSVSQCLILK